MSITVRTDGQLRTFENVHLLWDFIERESRRKHPECYAPNGEALKDYPGASWEERRVAWEFAQRMAEAQASADEEPEIPASDEQHEETRDEEQPYGRVRGEA